MSRVNVIQGQHIEAGDLIGYIGTTGRSTGPHLHYEIRKDGDDIDPVPFLKLNN
jgi:murein DD-endopeptidase MepM/ murein hydrolase activator NlpD